MIKLIIVILIASVFSSACVGDYIVFQSKYSNSQIFRAIADNLVHAIIGLFSSLLFFSYDLKISNPALVYNVVFCTLMSSVIDVDHVFVAGSLKWKDLTHLKHRGIFHCTTFWLAVTVFLILYSLIFKRSNIYVLTWMLVIAYTSHHIRDANRRGLWLYPYGHTEALSKSLYVIMLGILPQIFSLIYRNTVSSTYKHSMVQYSQWP